MDALGQQRISCESIPASAGIGLRGAHHSEFLVRTPAVSWIEVHSENFFCAGGAAHTVLTQARANYPLSLHGVGLSLGTTDALDLGHLRKLRELVGRYEPGLISEHLSWGSIAGKHLNDLLPLPYTREALVHVAARIDATQSLLGRRILIENISSYFQFAEAEMSEHEFFAELVQRSGCGVLLDVNNLFVNECNHGDSALEFIRRIPRGCVGEIHLAGHSVQTYDGHDIVVDTHDAPVCSAVWDLYETAIRRFGRVPTLIEWDSRLPALDVLIGEADKAEHVMEMVDALAA